MGLGDGLGDAEPQTSTTPSLSARFGGPIKTVEYVLLLILGEANPGVGNPQPGPVAVATQRKGDAATGGRVLDGVVQQVEQEPFQVLPVPVDGDRLQGTITEAYVMVFRQPPQLFADLFQEFF